MLLAVLLVLMLVVCGRNELEVTGVVAMVGVMGAMVVVDSSSLKKPPLIQPCKSNVSMQVAAEVAKYLAT